MYQYKPSDEQVNALKDRMRNGTGASRLLAPQNAPTHYIDALQRFKKDYASYDKQQRQLQKNKRQYELQKKRLDQLQRQNKRWEIVENYHDKLKSRQQINTNNLQMGIRRTANSSSLAYNPINMQYDNNPEGQRLKFLDEDSKIRRFVRAKNMQDRGNSKYNPINGQNRQGINKIIPEQLSQRYVHKLSNHYENLKLKAPSTDYTNQGRQSSFNYSPRYY